MELRDNEEAALIWETSPANEWDTSDPTRLVVIFLHRTRSFHKIHLNSEREGCHDVNCLLVGDWFSWSDLDRPPQWQFDGWQLPVPLGVTPLFNDVPFPAEGLRSEGGIVALLVFPANRHHRDFFDEDVAWCMSFGPVIVKGNKNQHIKRGILAEAQVQSDVKGTSGRISSLIVDTSKRRTAGDRDLFPIDNLQYIEDEHQNAEVLIEAEGQMDDFIRRHPNDSDRMRRDYDRPPRRSEDRRFKHHHDDADFNRRKRCEEDRQMSNGHSSTPMRDERSYRSRPLEDLMFSNASREDDNYREGPSREWEDEEEEEERPAPRRRFPSTSSTVRGNFDPEDIRADPLDRPRIPVVCISTPPPASASNRPRATDLWRFRRTDAYNAIVYRSLNNDERVDGVAVAFVPNVGDVYIQGEAKNFFDSDGDRIKYDVGDWLLLEIKSLPNRDRRFSWNRYISDTIIKKIVVPEGLEGTTPVQGGLEFRVLLDLTEVHVVEGVHEQVEILHHLLGSVAAWREDIDKYGKRGVMALLSHSESTKKSNRMYSEVVLERVLDSPPPTPILDEITVGLNNVALERQSSRMSEGAFDGSVASTLSGRSTPVRGDLIPPPFPNRWRERNPSRSSGGSDGTERGGGNNDPSASESSATISEANNSFPARESFATSPTPPMRAAYREEPRRSLGYWKDGEGDERPVRRQWRREEARDRDTTSSDVHRWGGREVSRGSNDVRQHPEIVYHPGPQVHNRKAFKGIQKRMKRSVN